MAVTMKKGSPGEVYGVNAPNPNEVINEQVAGPTVTVAWIVDTQAELYNQVT